MPRAPAPWIHRRSLALALALAGSTLIAGVAGARSFSPSIRGSQGELHLESLPAGPITPPTRGPHPGSHGSSVIADGAGLLIAERSAGALIRSDRAGAATGRLALTPGLGELVGDGRGLVFVADRGADRVLRIRPGDAAGVGLAIAGEVAIREPHGLALTPDGATLLVTSVADHQLIAVDVATLKVRWRRTLAAEPRGVAVSSDGAEAAVGFLSSGALAIVELAGGGARVRWQALNPRDQIDVSEDEDEFADSALKVELREARSRVQVPTSTGRRYARATFAVAYVGGDRLVAPHQVATPQLVQEAIEGQEDSYGGVQQAPLLVHRLAFVRRPGEAGAEAIAGSIELHQPRALAYDLGRDTLYVGAYGDDRLIAIADASLRSPRAVWVGTLGDRGGDACGIDGLAIADGRLYVHCELSRRIAAVDLAAIDRDRSAGVWAFGDELAPSARSPLVERGAEIFRRGADPRLSVSGVLACATCHPEGRADGLTWRLGPSILQTPVLAGRVTGTAPFKWDGQDRDLAASLRHTVQRLGGQPSRLSDPDFAALQAFIEALPRPRPRGDLDPAAVDRGRALFTSAALACDGCHAGATLSDGSQHPFKGPLPAVDTPSLIGLGHSAPYYHDGSAGDLYALVTDKGSIHDMVNVADLTGLSGPESADMIAFLSSL